MTHPAEAQLLLDIACAPFSTIKSMPAPTGGTIFRYALDHGAREPAEQQFEHYAIFGQYPSMDEALAKFTADVLDIIAAHGVANLRWRQEPKLSLLTHKESGQEYWKVTSRLIAALTPEAASQFPESA